MSAPRAEPGGSTPTPSPGPRRTRGRSPGGAGPARTSAAESLAPVSSVASRSCRWGPSSARAPYRARLATDERSGSESAITIPGMGDHDAPESVIRIERKERSRSAGTSDQDESEPARKEVLILARPDVHRVIVRAVLRAVQTVDCVHRLPAQHLLVAHEIRRAVLGARSVRWLRLRDLIHHRAVQAAKLLVVGFP